jgi:hypothetical protein
LDEVTLLITYWKEDQPIGGHTARMAADSLYKTGTVRVSLNNHIRYASRVLISVFSAISGDLVWRKPSSGQGSEFLKSALHGNAYQLAEEDWVQISN